MKPSCLAAASLTLMMRRETGNRSTIRTSTVFPFAIFVTFTREPNGYVACAATSSPALSRAPLAVRPPPALEVKNEAFPVSLGFVPLVVGSAEPDAAGTFARARRAERVDRDSDLSAAPAPAALSRFFSGNGDGRLMSCCAHSGSAKSEANSAMCWLTGSPCLDVSGTVWPTEPARSGPLLSLA